MDNNIQSSEDLKIRFEGNTHQIEANTLINNLLHFTNIVQEVNKDLGTGRSVEVKVNALPEGSFLIHLTVAALPIIEAAKMLFTSVIPTAADIVETVTGIYKLYKFLKGDTPESVLSTDNSTKITNKNGDVIIINNPTYNIYKNNRIIQEAISQEFQELDEDNNVEGFTLLDKQNIELVSIEKKEFEELGIIETNEILPNQRTIKEVAVLNIYTLSFDKKIKWTFYYAGNKITAKISEDFVIRIDNGEKFSKGDSLEAELEITQEFDSGVNTFINKSYRISKIIKHIPRSNQQPLFPN